MKSSREIGEELGRLHGAPSASPEESEHIEAVATGLLGAAIKHLRECAPGLGATNSTFILINTSVAFLASLDEPLVCEALILLGRTRRAAMQGKSALAERTCRELYEAQLKFHFLEVKRVQDAPPA